MFNDFLSRVIQRFVSNLMFWFCSCVAKYDPIETIICLGEHAKKKMSQIVEKVHKAVPPIRSGFPDHGPDPDFFEEIGPDLG